MNTDPTTPPNYDQLPVITFLDSVGRLIIAAVEAPAAESEQSDCCTSTTLKAIGPAVIDIVQGQAPGTFGIRIVPLVLTELLNNINERPTLTYPRSSIVVTNANLQDEIVANYRKTLAPPSQIITPQAGIATPAMSPKQLF